MTGRVELADLSGPKPLCDGTKGNHLTMEFLPQNNPRFGAVSTTQLPNPPSWGHPHIGLIIITCQPNCTLFLGEREMLSRAGKLLVITRIFL